MILKAQLEELQQQIDKDEKLVADLRLKRFVGAGGAYSEAKGRIALAREVLEDITAQYEAEQETLANRPNLEKAEAKFLDGAARALGKADDRLKAALEAAQTALVEVVEATAARSALVDETAVQLTARGLKLRDESDSQPHETGTERQLSGAAVRIRGQWWAPVAALDLLDWLKHRVTAARMPAVMIPFCHSCKRLDARTDGFFPSVAAVPAVPLPERPHALHAPVEGAVSYISSVTEHERRIDEEELRWRTVAVPKGDGEVDWRREPPTDEMKRRAAHRKKGLHDAVAAGRVVVR